MKLTLFVSPKRVAQFLLCVVFMMVLASSIGPFIGHERIFLLTSETSIPTWYQSTALLCSAMLLTVITWIKKQTADPYWRHWLILTPIFLLLAIDEASEIHEGLNILRDLLGTSGFLHYAWIIPVGLALIILTIFYWRFLFSLPTRTRNLLFMAGALFIGGALGLEAVAGFLLGHYASGSTPHIIITTIEETSEMVGTVVFIYALLDYLRTQLQTADIHIQFPPE